MALEDYGYEPDNPVVPVPLDDDEDYETESPE